MELLILLLAFAVLGYLIGTSRLGRDADRATERAAEVSGSWAERLSSAWKSTFARRSLSDKFRIWVISQPTEAFSDSERLYLSGLSNGELKKFVKSLNDYAQGLGFNLRKLVDGEMDSDPRLRTVFVEAISVYSSAYRKARQEFSARHAQQEADSNPQALPSSGAAGDGKSPAEKEVSRRKEGENNHVTEPAATD